MIRALLAPLVVCAGCGHGFFDPLPVCDAKTADTAVGSDSAGPAIVYAQSNFNTSAGAAVTTLTVSFPVAIATNDLLVAVVAWDGTSATIANLVDSVGNTYMVAAGPTRAAA
jgi:hypothetical protein